MLRTFLIAKIHRAVVTETNLDYEGSLTVDEHLLQAGGILPFEQVEVVNVTTGARFSTYVIPGEPGSGVIGLNGGAARLGQRGDRLIVMAYGLLQPEEIGRLRPRVVLVDESNRVRSVVSGEAARPWLSS